MKADRFPARLKELREAAGLTQVQLADKAGFTKDGIAQWESGRRVPSWPNVVALAQALGVSCEDFLKEPASQERPARGRPRKNTAVKADQPKKNHDRKSKTSESDNQKRIRE